MLLLLLVQSYKNMLYYDPDSKENIVDICILSWLYIRSQIIRLEDVIVGVLVFNSSLQAFTPMLYGFANIVKARLLKCMQLKAY